MEALESENTDVFKRSDMQPSRAIICLGEVEGLFFSDARREYILFHTFVSAFSRIAQVLVKEMSAFEESSTSWNFGEVEESRTERTIEESETFI